MEDIDKNGDGLIDLDEYIGETLDFHYIICHSNLWIKTEISVYIGFVLLSHIKTTDLPLCYR